MAIIPSSTTQYSAPDVPHPFRQNMNYFYLTGHDQPDALLVCTLTNNTFNDYLFLPPFCPNKLRWEGPSLTSRNSAESLELSKVLDFSEIKSFLWSHEHCHVFMDNLESSWLLIAHDLNVGDKKCISPFISDMRIRKSDWEASKMAKSSHILGEALKIVMNKSVKEMVGLLSQYYQCDLLGGEGFAFPPVVACGDNSTIIHYMKYKGEFRRGELILVDSGCEVGHYCSDMTRVWPSCGECGQILKECFPVLRGRCMNVCWRPIWSVLRHLKDKIRLILSMRLYISRDCGYVYDEYRGIGIRIEDDLLITQNGGHVLTKKIEKSARAQTIRNTVKN
ncbi:intermediate cleaving peptidase 55, mitochondrial-like [Octopus sinensis]|uniref:Intermediate cleaving peptidase 55, mitochondrial-like n=1 Tax=Octopus sinensis TaxID=2607531 RepID=A0A7E6EKQ9_9MOLL|nr:intermediate cleaving peptidase 55, mitochondrial-like [Octopus sinensis]